MTSSSIFVEGFVPKLPRHKNSKSIIENKISTPTPDFLFDTTKCYGHREAFNMPRVVSEKFETNAAKKVAKMALKHPELKTEYASVKQEMELGTHPVNLSAKSTYVSSTKVLVKKSEGRYIVDVSDTNVDILGVGCRTDKKSMKTFKTLMNKLYGLDLKGY